MTSNSRLENLSKQLSEKQQRSSIPFNKFLDEIANNPYPILRNIFQLYYDFIHYYIPKGVDEYPDDPESINFIHYDCTRLFVEGTNHPFFADRLFANKLVRLTDSLKMGSQQNKIYLFEGPHGCGKSTFLNNLLAKFEEYTNTSEGMIYETIWKLDKEKIDWTQNKSECILYKENDCKEKSDPNLQKKRITKYLEVPCPGHDNPILIIPKSHRKKFLDDLIKDEEFKKKFFNSKEYEWVFKWNPCTVCTSLYQALLDRLGSVEEVFNMLFAQKYVFNKRLGRGVSVFNAGDPIYCGPHGNAMTNEAIQNQLAELLGDSNKVQYIFSRYAKTNNGIYALMDIKGDNKQRLINLHGIISEGVHKVDDLEENVTSLFIAVINPEDKQDIQKEEMKSFLDRLHYIRHPYVLDYDMEAEIYKSVFGEQINENFLPRVLQNFTKIIVSSRLEIKSEALSKWIGASHQYNRYCDDNFLLLKMDLYRGIIPSWLSEEHRKNFTAKIRRKIIFHEAENEGFKGFSGRESIDLFNEFYSTFAKKDKLITMTDVSQFFSKKDDLCKKIPQGFLESLKNLYDYNVLQEVKEALYYYNEEKISRDIQNYLFAINFDVGKMEKVKCEYTGDTIELTEAFFENIERRILGSDTLPVQRRIFREYTQKQYASNTVTQEIQIEGKKITETTLYKNLLDRCTHNLKKNVFDPFIKNDNFRNAVKEYGTKEFKTYDQRIKEDVDYLIKNLQKKFNYTEEGARQMCIYVIDNNLAQKFL